jgi:hypothetical protein
MKKFTLAFAASAIVAMSALTAQADTLSPAFGRTIELGAINGVAYYTVEKEGYRVVATLADAGSTPVRFEAVLAPGQSVIVSSPNAYGEEPAKVQISRQSDGVRVERLPLTN